MLLLHSSGQRPTVSGPFSFPLISAIFSSFSPAPTTLIFPYFLSFSADSTHLWFFLSSPHSSFPTNRLQPPPELFFSSPSTRTAGWFHHFLPLFTASSALAHPHSPLFQTKQAPPHRQFPSRPSLPSTKEKQTIPHRLSPCPTAVHYPPSQLLPTSSPLSQSTPFSALNSDGHRPPGVAPVTIAIPSSPHAKKLRSSAQIGLQQQSFFHSRWAPELPSLFSKEPNSSPHLLYSRPVHDREEKGNKELICREADL